MHNSSITTKGVYPSFHFFPHLNFESLALFPPFRIRHCFVIAIKLPFHCYYPVYLTYRNLRPFVFNRNDVFNKNGE